MNTFLAEVNSYNTAVQSDVRFGPNVKDGCGITFTFGGLRIDPDSGQVMDVDLVPIRGLYAAGELVGGVFYFNCPGGTGLLSGSVFGRLAGNSAANARR